MCLSEAVIGVLSDDYDFDFVEWAEVECVEYELSGRVYVVSAVFVAYEVGKLAEVVFIEFGLQACFPSFFYLDVHNGYGMFIVYKCEGTNKIWKSKE